MPNYSAILSAEVFADNLRAARFHADYYVACDCAKNVEASHTALLSLCGELREALDAVEGFCTFPLTRNRVRELLAAYPLTKGAGE